MSERTSAKVVGSMLDFLPIGDGMAIVGRLHDPAIRIVSLTVTEGGYFLDGDGVFDAAHPAILADASRPDDPRTVPGLLLKALRARRDAGIAPFTVLSCDNLPGNGNVMRTTLTGLARMSDARLADWIAANVAFPNSMVDRITPVTSDRERDAVRLDYGVADMHHVYAEDFAQWVIEDEFPSGRPALEDVGVTFTGDVSPYEAMKLGILNASHALLAYPAALLAIEFVHAALDRPLLARLVRATQTSEVIPGLELPAFLDARAYLEQVLRRFANPRIADTVARICYDGSNRQPKFIVPAIRRALRKHLPVCRLAMASALWCHYCVGRRADGTSIAPNDPDWIRLTSVAAAAQDRPEAWLDQYSIYGEVGQDERFRTEFRSAVYLVREEGVENAVKAAA